MEYDRSKLKFEDHTEDIWVIARVGDGDVVREAHSTESGAIAAERRDDFPWGVESVKVKLHRPSLRPIYGGSTLVEALWVEMDRLMEGLMTGTDAEDGGDKYRAQELAWVLAIVTNAYNPSVDRIRAEAVARWNTQQEAAEEITAAEEEQHNWDAAGVSGYEL